MRIVPIMAQNSIILVFLLCIAALCLNGSEFVLSLLGIGLAFLVAGFTAVFLSRSFSLFDYSPEMARVMWLIFGIIPIVIFLRHYHRPNRLNHASWLSSLLLVFIPAEFIELPVHDELKQIDSSESNILLQSHLSSVGPGHQMVEIEFENLDPTQVWRLTDVYDPPNHAKVRMATFDHARSLVKSPAINNQLGLAACEIEGPNTYPRIISLSSTETGNLANDTSRVLQKFTHSTARLERIRLAPVGRMAIQHNSSVNTQSLRANLEQLLTQEGRTSVTFTLSIPHSPNSGSSISVGESPLFVFVDHDAQRASIVNWVNKGTHHSFSAGFAGRYRIDLPLNWNYTPASRIELLIADIHREGYVLLHSRSD